MSVEVREAGREDLPVWRDLRLRALRDSPDAFGSTYEREAGFTDEDWLERLTRPGSLPLLAYVDGAPAGLGGALEDPPGWWHVVSMWTEPAYRGRGAGTAVLARLVGAGVARGLRVHLDVETGNPGARAVYERAGFTGTGETRPLREGSSLRMERMVLAD